MTLSRFKQYMRDNIKFIMVMYAVVSIVIAVVVLCYRNNFICEKVVTALLVMYIIYIFISLVDVILVSEATKKKKLWSGILNFTGKNINIKKKGKKKGINDHAGRNNEDPERPDKLS